MSFDISYIRPTVFGHEKAADSYSQTHLHTVSGSDAVQPSMLTSPEQDAPQELINRGSDLHNEVPKYCWCVTRSDLCSFRADVRHAIQEGRISPTQQDPFDPDDDVIGPTVYTVVDQLVKPVTSLAGGQSWALMRHPRGLKCDLYVTHAWIEGTFEFIDKVLNSWPLGARHAYCCMLSNPQNSDISNLIACPLDSPFAAALASARFMLVVPNEKCSIYCRIWCAYEAFLAISWNKSIYVAITPDKLPRRRLILPYYAVPLAALVCYAILEFALPAPSLEIEVFMYKCCFALNVTVWIVIALFLPPSCDMLVRLAIIASVCVAGASFALGERVFREYGSLGQFRVVHLIWSLLICPFNLALIVDDQRRLRSICSQTRNLQRHYSGNVREAQASQAHDKALIMEEIYRSGQEADVDASLKHLLCTGMSTPTLRDALAQGFDVVSAGSFKHALIVGPMSGLLFHGLSCVTLLESKYEHTCGGIIIGLSLGQALETALLSPDERAFASMTCAKLWGCIWLPLALLDWMSIGLGDDVDTLEQRIDEMLQGMMRRLIPLNLIIQCLVCCILSCGLKRLPHVPCVGHWMVRLILAQPLREH